MARIARVVVPGIPHHVTQRGNRREPIFFRDEDYQFYRTLIAEAVRHAGAAVWGYCLMPNHVHLIVTPDDEDGLRKSFAEAHRRYTGAINARFQWTGHLFQGRFGAVAMDEAHFLAASRYVALNPVVAGLVNHARDWPWSSVGAHLSGQDDELVQVAPLLTRIENFAEFIAASTDEAVADRLERAHIIGRPLGSPDWVASLEERLRRPLAPRKRGPKPRSDDATQTDQRDTFK